MAIHSVTFAPKGLPKHLSEQWSPSPVMDEDYNPQATFDKEIMSLVRE
jgi:hypothetical protein